MFLLMHFVAFVGKQANIWNLKIQDLDRDELGGDLLWDAPADDSHFGRSLEV